MAVPSCWYSLLPSCADAMLQLQPVPVTAKAALQGSFLLFKLYLMLKEPGQG